MITNKLGINKKNGIDIVCLNEKCKKSFYISKSRINKKKFCSKKCLNQWKLGKKPKII